MVLQGIVDQFPQGSTDAGSLTVQALWEVAEMLRAFVSGYSGNWQLEPIPTARAVPGIKSPDTGLLPSLNAPPPTDPSDSQPVEESVRLNETKLARSLMESMAALQTELKVTQRSEKVLELGLDELWRTTDILRRRLADGGPVYLEKPMDSLILWSAQIGDLIVETTTRSGTTSARISARQGALAGMRFHRELGTGFISVAFNAAVSPDLARSDIAQEGRSYYSMLGWKLILAKPLIWLQRKNLIGLILMGMSLLSHSHLSRAHWPSTSA